MDKKQELAEYEKDYLNRLANAEKPPLEEESDESTNETEIGEKVADAEKIQAETAEKLQAKAQNAQLVADQISELKSELESLKTLANNLPTERKTPKRKSAKRKPVKRKSAKRSAAAKKAARARKRRAAIAKAKRSASAKKAARARKRKASKRRKPTRKGKAKRRR